METRRKRAIQIALTTQNNFSILDGGKLEFNIEWELKEGG
jgi:hypothetical protein